MTQPKVDNKWVKKACAILQETIRDLATHHTNKQLRSIKIKNWGQLENLLTQTQQETLEWCDREIANKIGQWEFDYNLEKASESFTDWLEKKISQTIKKKMEEIK